MITGWKACSFLVCRKKAKPTTRAIHTRVNIILRCSLSLITVTIIRQYQARSWVKVVRSFLRENHISEKRQNQIKILVQLIIIKGFSRGFPSRKKVTSWRQVRQRISSFFPSVLFLRKSSYPPTRNSDHSTRIWQGN